MDEKERKEEKTEDKKDAIKEEEREERKEERREEKKKATLDELDVFVDKSTLTRKFSGPGSVSSAPSSNPGSPRYHHRPPRRAASERRRSRHHHHHHHQMERKGSVMASTSHGGLEGRRTSRVADRRMSHALGDTSSLLTRSRTNSVSEHRRLSGTDSCSLPGGRKQSERPAPPSSGMYMSPGLNMAGSYRTPGAEIVVASLIITVGLVALIVSFTTGMRVWMIVGSVCMALGGMSLILGLCWYCSQVKEKAPDEESGALSPREPRVVTNEEIRAKLLHHKTSSSVKNGKGPQSV